LEELIDISLRIVAVPHLIDLFQTRLSFEKLIDRFYGYEDAAVIDLGAGFEAWPEFNGADPLDLQGLLVSLLEESWLPPNLDQRTTPHHLLNEYVDEGKLDGILVHPGTLYGFKVEGRNIFQSYRKG